MIKPKNLIRLLSTNIKKSGNPVGIADREINTWWRDVEIKRNGKWLLFTGLLYQIVPYAEVIARFFEKIEDTFIQDFVQVLNLFSKYPLRLLIDRKLKNHVDIIIQGIYEILENNGVDVYYIPEADGYSGILLHDLGMDEMFEEHAKAVLDRLERIGARKIITIDPHTTYALKMLYPKKFEIKAYFEVIDVSGECDQDVVIHDPCYYGRYLCISDAYRKVLRNIGIRYTDVKNSGKLTSCCGGLMNVISPKISKEIAKLRLEELGDKKIVTLCPICLENLRRLGADVEDFALLLKRCIQNSSSA